MQKKLDIGCGRNKQAGFTGMDIHPWEGVDIVWDLENFPWPVEDNSFDYVQMIHVIEHINDQVGLFAELHRITRNNGIIHIETPHFSCDSSWGDPTHVKHFSLFFTDQFCGNGYLADRTGKFELVRRRVNFGSLWGSMRSRFIVKFFGYRKWERRAFQLPARNIYVDLKVIK